MPLSFRVPRAGFVQGPLLNAPSGKPAWTLVLADPGAALPEGAPQSAHEFNEALVKLGEAGLLHMKGGLSGLATCEFTKDATRTDAQQAELAASPAVKVAFDLLKARTWLLLVITGRNPDKHRLDKIVHLLGAEGTGEQDKHFDDAWLLTVLLHLYPTNPSKVATTPIPTFLEALHLIQQHEGMSVYAEVMRRIRDWSVATAERWLPLFVNILKNGATQAPVNAVTATSAMLVEPGVLHHAPAVLTCGADPDVPGGPRSSIVASVKEVDGPVVDGSFLAQDLAVMHLEPSQQSMTVRPGSILEWWPRGAQAARARCLS